MELIQLKEVSKKYRKNTILRDINLKIEKGDIFGIIGQSGSGKTTLLNLISGFVEPSEGEVVYFSKVDHKPKNLHKNFHRIKKHLGFTPQHPSFYPKLTVRENILHFGQLYGLDKNTLITNATSLLKFTELYNDRKKLSSHLSGGMQKRLDITCSLTHKPKVLLLDEPTADLDPLLQEDILRLIKEVNKQGVTIIIASHHLDGIEKVCNKLAILHNGSIESYGNVEDVKKPFLKKNVTINIKIGKDKERLIAFVRRLPINRIVDQGDMLVVYPYDVQRTISALLQVVEQENLYLHDIDFHQPSLNEIFGKIANRK